MMKKYIKPCIALLILVLIVVLIPFSEQEEYKAKTGYDDHTHSWSANDDCQSTRTKPTSTSGAQRYFCLSSGTNKGKTNNPSYTSTTCSTCNGAKTLKCTDCSGKGYTETTTNATGTVPSGSTAGIGLTYKSYVTRTGCATCGGANKIVTYYGNTGASGATLGTNQPSGTYSAGSGKMSCTTCYGSGKWGTCSHCNGTGYNYVCTNSNCMQNYDDSYDHWETESGYNSLCYQTPKVLKITLNNQSATTAGTTVYYQKYDTGLYTTSACSTTISKITIPTKDGYNFGGYYTATNGGGTQYIDAAGNISATKSTFASDTTLYAKWTAKTVTKYTLTFNPMGGKMNGSTNNAAVTVTYGSGNYNTMNGASIPTRDGYDFAGWYTSTTGGTKVYGTDGKAIAGTSYWNSSSQWCYSGDVTLYARWTPHTYKVQYNANGGSGSMSTTTHTYGTSSNVSKNTFTKNGYTFNGWYAYRQSDSKWLYYNGSTFTWFEKDKQTSGYSLYIQGDKSSVTAMTPINNDTIVFYAIWKPNEYFVEYDNGGGSGSMEASTHTYGTPSNISKNTFTNPGYSFDGWSIYRESDGTWLWAKADGSSAGWYTEANKTSACVSKYLYPDEQAISTITAVNEDTITLQAQWKNNTFLVKYDGNGGAGSMASTTVTYNVPSAIKECTYTLTGHESNGWNLYRESDGTWLWAKANGDIAGWYTEGNKTSDCVAKYEITSGHDISTMTTANNDVIICYANWSEKSYTVSYTSSGASNMPATQVFQYGSGDSISTLVPTRDGYTFDKWQTTVNGTTYYMQPGDPIPTDWTSFSLHAIFNNNKYEIHYNANGGTGTMEPSSATYSAGVTTTTKCKFTYTGHRFKGWNAYRESDNKWLWADANGNNVGWYTQEEKPSNCVSKYLYKDGATVYNLTSVNNDKIIFFAVWENNVFTVTFDGNGGVSSIESAEYEGGSSVDLSPTASKDGYRFIGWSTDPDGTFPLDWLEVTGNVTLYAMYSIAVSDVGNHTYPDYDVNGTNLEVIFMVWEVGNESNRKTLPLTYDYDVNIMKYRYYLDEDISELVKDMDAYACAIYAYDNAGNESLLWEYNSPTPPPPPVVPEEFMQTVEHYYEGQSVPFDITTEVVKKGETFDPSTHKKSIAGFTASVNSSSYTVLAEKTTKITYKPNVYTLTFDANGGTCNPTSKSVTYNAPYGALPKPEKPGYDFIGWNTQDDGSGTYITSSDIYTILGNSTLHAQWKAKVFTITLDSTDADTHGTEEYFVKYNTNNYTTNECNTVIYKITMPTKEGYAFKGYFTEQNGKGERVINSTGTFRSTIGSTQATIYFTEDTTIYAHFEPITYNIEFISNGESVSTITATYNVDVPLTVTPDPEIGYYHEGWSKIEGGSKDYAIGQMVKNLTSVQGATVKLYAVWKPNIYQINLNNAGADTGKGGTEEYFVEYNTKYYTTRNRDTEITKITVPIKTGHTFKGYKTEPDGKGYLVIDASGVLQSTINGKAAKTYFTSDTTLYADWEEHSYKIIYHANGGTGSMEPTSVKYTERVNLSENKFERVGHKHIGWALAKNGDVAYAPGQEVSMLTSANGGEITLYAVWEVLSYKVVYDYMTNGGTGASVQSDQVNYNASVNLSVSATKGNGWVWVGWNTDANATTGLTSFKMPAHDVTLYAIYKKDIKVTFIDRNSSGIVTNKKDIILYNNDKEYSLTIPTQNTWGNWTSLGWSLNEDADAEIHTSGGATYLISENETFYGRYEMAVTLKYDTKGSNDTIAEQSGVRQYNASGNSKNPEVKIAESPTLSNHSFVTWKDLNASVNYTPGQMISLSNNMTLTAVWDKHPSIEAYNRYFTLQQAQDGEISITELLRKVTAVDQEDGILTNGIDVNIKNYNADVFTSLTEDTDVNITYEATDSFGNSVTKTVKIQVIDSTAKKSSRVTYYRFISSRFYTDGTNLLPANQGGLEETSIWRTNATYRSLLEAALNNKKFNQITKTFSYLGVEKEILIKGSGDWERVEETWYFTREDLNKLDEFTENYGFGYSKIGNYLEKFLEWFGHCKK